MSNDSLSQMCFWERVAYHNPTLPRLMMGMRSERASAREATFHAARELFGFFGQIILKANECAYLGYFSLYLVSAKAFDLLRRKTIFFLNKLKIKLSEMQNLSMVFKSNFDYNHRVKHKKFLWNKFLLSFQESLFSPGGTF